MEANLNLVRRHLLPNLKSNMAAIVAILKFFKPHLLPNRKSVLAGLMMGGIGGTCRFRTAKIVLYQYPR